MPKHARAKIMGGLALWVILATIVVEISAGRAIRSARGAWFQVASVVFAVGSGMVMLTAVSAVFALNSTRRTVMEALYEEQEPRRDPATDRFVGAPSGGGGGGAAEKVVELRAPTRGENKAAPLEAMEEGRRQAEEGSPSATMRAETSTP